MNYWRKYPFTLRSEAEAFAKSFKAEVKREFNESLGQTVFFVAW